MIIETKGLLWLVPIILIGIFTDSTISTKEQQVNTCDSCLLVEIKNANKELEAEKNVLLPKLIRKVKSGEIAKEKVQLLSKENKLLSLEIKNLLSEKSFDKPVENKLKTFDTIIEKKSFLFWKKEKIKIDSNENI